MAASKYIPAVQGKSGNGRADCVCNDVHRFDTSRGDERLMKLVADAIPGSEERRRDHDP
jgi:hypothetical protein